MDHIGLVASLFGVHRDLVEGWAHEAEKLNLQVERKLGGRRLWAIGTKERVLLYCVTRAVHPTIAVETGVGPGVSTTFILAALGQGVLHSFDLGVKYGDEQETYPVGFVVPEELRSKWRLHLGDSKKLLEPFYLSLGQQKIQLFLHDGEHTYSNVAKELMLAWQHMDRGAILVDNYDWTDAPKHFAENVGAALYHAVEDMCVIPKGV